MCDAKENRTVSIWDLKPRQALAFLRYRQMHPYRPIERPRASWAQLLVALGILNVKPLILRLVGSDTVHSNLDTPLQRVSVRDLGHLAFVLGFQSVKIDISNRTFLAFSPAGSITTEEVPVLGKVLRFEGDIVQLHGTIGRCVPSWIARASRLIVGQASFGIFRTNGIFWPLGLLGSCISTGNENTEYKALERQTLRRGRTGWSVGPVLREVYLMKDTFLDLLRSKPSNQRPGASLTQVRCLIPWL